jgi:transcriptional regulator with XRE-family HTH domain
MTSFESIGERIKKIRKEKELTQYELADKVGTTHCSISMWEEGKRNMSVYYFARLCKALDVSADYILYGEEQEE